MKLAERKSDITWMERAACLNEDPELFWIDPERDGDSRMREYKAQVARSICETCPVRDECRLWGLLEAVNDHWSILGGLTHRQRKWIRREVGWS